MEELKSLVISAQSGDVEAFGAIVQRFQDMAYGYAYSILGDFHLAEDIAQESFIDAYCQLQKLRDPAAFPGWFRRIVFNRCGHITRRKRMETVPLDAAVGVATQEPGPLHMVEQTEMQERVLEAIRALPEHQRMVTTLFYINGYSQVEIAEFLEVSVRTVKRRLFDSRSNLKERMIDMVDETLKGFSLPNDFADIVVRKAVSQEELGSISELVEWHAQNRPEHFRSVKASEEAGLYVVGERGQVEGAGYLKEASWGIGTTILKAGKVGEMAGESEGVPDPIFVRSCQACFKLAKERGIRLIVIHGSQYDHAFCGFVPSFYHALATLSCEKAKSIVSCATVRETLNEEETQEGWEAFMRDPYATKTGGGWPGPVTHVVEQDGMPVGYLGSVTLQKREAALAALKFWGNLAEEAGEDQLKVPQSHMTMVTQTILSLGGKYLLRSSCDLVGLDNEMVAIIDLAGLTRDLQGEFQNRLNASAAHDADGCFSIEMSGTTVGFLVNSGRVEIVTQKQAIHRVLPRWVVTRLYMGYYSGEDVLVMGSIPCDRSDGRTPDDPDMDMKELSLPENEAALLKALFPKLWPCSTPDPDVWRWMTGKEPIWRYRHGDEEPKEMKAQIDALRFPWIGY